MMCLEFKDALEFKHDLEFQDAFELKDDLEFKMRKS